MAMVLTMGIPATDFEHASFHAITPINATGISQLLHACCLPDIIIRLK
jgi:hypothetical protein